MFKCKICNLEFPSKQKLGGHVSSHNRGEEYRSKRETRKSAERKRKSLEKIKTCIYCKKDFETGSKLGGHIITCEFNPTRSQTIDKIRNSNKGKKTSEESKEKISNSMKLAHLEGKAWNIGKSRWNNQPSYPEEFFMKVIDNNFSNKEYTREYPVGIYSIDFAWIESKKCIEIDGDQHQRFEEYRKRDERKDKLLKEEGWEILRIKWKDLYYDPSNWIQKSYQFIHTER
jgi:very-short-patch-repair endonuclease